MAVSCRRIAGYFRLANVSRGPDNTCFLPKSLTPLPSSEDFYLAIMAQTPPPPPYSKNGHCQIETRNGEFITSQPIPTTLPSTILSQSPVNLEEGAYSIDTVCDNCGLIIANIPKCVGEGVCLSWTMDDCCGTEGSCDPEDACFICCTACSSISTTFGLVLRDILTCHSCKGARKFVLAALFMMALMWLIGRGRMW